MLVRMVVWRHNQNFDPALVQVNFIPGNIPLWLSTNCLLSSFFGWFWSDKYHVHIFDIYIFCICCKDKCKTTKIFSFYLIFLWLADAFLFIADQQMLRLLALSTFGTVLFLLLHWQCGNAQCWFIMIIMVLGIKIIILTSFWGTGWEFIHKNHHKIFVHECMIMHEY